MASDPQTSIVLGIVTGAHGVSGRVKVKPFTEVPEGVGEHGPVLINGETRKIKVTSISKGQVICELDGIRYRDQAEALRGAEISVLREALADSDDEEGWFHTDLMGLPVEDLEGKQLGRVIGVHDFGAGDLLEIEPADGASVLMAFTEANVPTVDLQAGKLVADPPLGTFASEEEMERPKRKRRRSPKARARENARTGDEDGNQGGDAAEPSDD